MKAGNVILMTLRSMRKKLGINVALLLLLSFLLFMSQLIVVTWMGPRTGKLIAEKQMGEKFSQWGEITLDSNQNWDENVWNFLQNLHISGTVDRIGTFEIMGMMDDGLSELTDIQNTTGVKANTLLNDDTFYTYMSDNILLFDYGFIEDTSLLEKYSGEDDILLLLGDGYQSIEVGRVYQSALLTDRRYVVVGHLPRGYSFFSDTIYRDDHLFNAGLVNALDDMAIMVFQDQNVMAAEGLFYIEEGVTTDRLEDIQEYADACGVNVSLTRLETIYERNHRSSLEESTEALPYFVAIFISAGVLLISYYLADLIGHKKKYGVYYAVGFQHRDVFWLMFAENAFRFLIALCISCALFFKFFRWVYPKGVVAVQAETVIFASSTLAAFITGGMLLLCAVCIPMRLLQKASIGELLCASNE